MKAATATSWSPKTFVPTFKQYEKGVWFTPPSTKIPIFITKDGYRPATAEDEAKLLSIIEHDKYCGICLFGKQEMSQNERAAVDVAIAKDKENAQLREQMEELRQQLQLSKAANATSGKG